MVNEGVSPSHGTKSLWNEIDSDTAIFGEYHLPQALTLSQEWSDTLYGHYVSLPLNSPPPILFWYAFLSHFTEDGRLRHREVNKASPWGGEAGDEPQVSLPVRRGKDRHEGKVLLPRWDTLTDSPLAQWSAVGALMSAC